MSRVLVIGSGAREHALAWKLSRSFKVGKVFVAPGNPGMTGSLKTPPFVTEGVVETVEGFSPLEIERLMAFAINERISLSVVGPEAPLAAGIVDEFDKMGLPVFGPTAKAAELESSKAFAKNIMKNYDIPTAKFEVFSDIKAAITHLQKMTPPYVIKANGLAGGKGVLITSNLHEAEDTLNEMMVEGCFGDAGKSVVIEEYLVGKEFSYMAFVHGKNVYPLLPARDYKRAFDADEGPNTGGMGAYAPVPDIGAKEQQEALEKILQPIANAMVEEGRPYKGLLYAGLIATEDGIKVIEFNVRFGDPEAGVVLPLLESDLYVVMTDFLAGKPPTLTWSKNYCVGVVFASKGYPGDYKKGYKITGLENLESETNVFFSGITDCGKGPSTDGGRVLLAARKSGSLVLARNELYEDITKIECENLYYRTDIAKS